MKKRECRHIGGVQIVEHDQHRLFFGEALKKIGEGFVHSKSSFGKIVRRRSTTVVVIAATTTTNTTATATTFKERCELGILGLLLFEDRFVILARTQTTQRSTPRKVSRCSFAFPRSTP